MLVKVRFGSVSDRISLTSGLDGLNFTGTIKALVASPRTLIGWTTFGVNTNG